MVCCIIFVATTMWREVVAIMCCGWGCKSRVLGLFGLRGSNLLESSLLESLGLSVTVLISSRLSIAISGVLVSLNMMSSSLSLLSAERGEYCATGLRGSVSICLAGEIGINSSLSWLTRLG